MKTLVLASGLLLGVANVAYAMQASQMSPGMANPSTSGTQQQENMGTQRNQGFDQNQGVNPSNRGVNPSGAAATEATNKDYSSTDTFVQTVAMTNMFEIESSNLALTKSTDTGVKTFARRMIKDHTASNDKLKSLVASQKINVPMPTELDAKHQALLEKLQGLNGEQFDHEFAQLQTQAHEHALVALREYAAKGHDAQLKKFASADEKTIESHIAAAHKLEHAAM